ncbi:hypothetical protein OUZ56_000347 [Daphnia magna]|uniref:Uncharacterized protein n=1 Tax=Daphnia magna TaxID=35525 RepID=A0ABQ9ZZF5_9CRUS|nr:hypothetical protein OUZ56_000347 [Daphnia magna]
MAMLGTKTLRLFLGGSYTIQKRLSRKRRTDNSPSSLALLKFFISQGMTIEKKEKTTLRFQDSTEVNIRHG